MLYNPGLISFELWTYLIQLTNISTRQYLIAKSSDLPKSRAVLSSLKAVIFQVFPISFSGTPIDLVSEI